MSLALDCAGVVSTDSVTGALLCHDSLGAPLAFEVVPSFDVTALDSTAITAYFSAGYLVIALGFLIGKAVSIVLQVIKDL